jgi:hypothetical protein
VSATLFGEGVFADAVKDFKMRSWIIYLGKFNDR